MWLWTNDLEALHIRAVAEATPGPERGSSTGAHPEQCERLSDLLKLAATVYAARHEPSAADTAAAPSPVFFCGEDVLNRA